MLGIGLNIKPRVVGGGQLIGYYRISETTKNVGVHIVKKSDTAPKTILKYLDYKKDVEPDVYPVYWDGLTDLGADVIAGNDWEVEIVSNQIEFNWTTALNTSAINHGSTLYHSYSGASGAVAVDSNIVFIDLYNEAGNRVAFKCSQSALQAKSNILGAGTPNSGNINATNSVLQYVTYDANYIYFGGSNGPSSTLGNIIHAVKRSDLSEVTFTNGYTAGDASTRNYTSVIGDNDNTHILTGLCAANGFLYAAYAGQNKIDCMDCTSATTPSGAIVSTRSTSVDNCREIDWDSQHQRIIGLRTFSGDTEALFRMTINSGTGAMSAPSALSLSVTATGKITLRINNNTHVLAILYGETEQFILLFDISATNPTGSVTSKIGVVGGMQATSTVANDRFIFTDYSGGLSFALRKPWLAVNLANDQWIIGDVGNERTVITDSLGVYVDKIQWQPSTYSVAQDETNPYYVSANGLVAEKIGSEWVHTKNYRQLITSDFLTSEKYGYFENLFTLLVGGVEKQVATLVDISYLNTGSNYDGVYSYRPTQLVALENTITYYGVNINQPHQDYLGVLKKYSDSALASYRLTANTWTAGGIPELKRVIIEFSSGVPVIGSEQTISTFEPIVANDTLDEDVGFAFLGGISNDGMAIVYNNSLDARFTEHLAGYEISSGRKVFGTYFHTTQLGEDSKIGYSGEYVDLRYTQRGNGINNNFQDAKVFGNFIYIHEKQENFRGKQAAINNIWTSTGRMITQVGITSQEGDALEESAPRAAGNGVSFHAAIDPNNSDKVILCYGDESRRSAISIEEGTGFRTIKSKTYKLLTPPTDKAYNSHFYSLLGDLPRSSEVVTGGRIALSHAQSASFKVQTNILRWDKPDLYLWLNCGAEHGSYKYVDIALNAFDPDLTKFIINAVGNWYGYDGGEDIATYPNIEPSAMYQCLDNLGRIIWEFGLGQGNVTNHFKISANNVEMLNFVDQYTYVTRIGKNKMFSVQTDVNGCTFNWDGETVTAPFYDPLAVWCNPAILRIVVRDRDTSHQGVRVISISEPEVTELFSNPVAPNFISGQTFDETHIDISLDSVPSEFHLNGFYLKIDGVLDTLTSVSRIGKILRFSTTSTLAFGQVLTFGYVTQLSNKTQRTGLQLTSFIDQAVTNNIIDASSAIVVQRKASGWYSVTFDTDPIAGNFLIFVASGTIAAFGTSAIYSNGDAVIQIRDEHAGFGTGLSIFMVYNTTGGSNKTFSVSGIASNGSCMAFEIQNPKNSANPLLSQDGDQGTAAVLSKTLVTAVRSLIIAAYANGNGSKFISFGGGITLDLNSGNNAVGFILNQSAGSVNPLVNVTPDSNNVAVFAAIELQ